MLRQLLDSNESEYLCKWYFTKRREHDKVIVFAYSEYVTNRAHYTRGIGLVYWVKGNTIRRYNIVVVLLLEYLNNVLIVTKSKALVWFVITTTNSHRVRQDMFTESSMRKND